MLLISQTRNTRVFSLTNETRTSNSQRSTVMCLYLILISRNNQEQLLPIIRVVLRLGRFNSK
jgi:hypothetical protein